MKHPRPIQIWFLDDNLQKSASYLTNRCLEKSISGCINALISAHMYCAGIRSKKFYKHFFSKEHCQDTIDKHFSNWPFAKSPSFSMYSSRTSKWCRMCKEHYDYIYQYLCILFDEYSFRKSKLHNLQQFIDWHENYSSIDLTYANIAKISLPWKDISLKWRRKDIIESYRLQFMNSFQKEPFDEYHGTNRDIPDFVVKYFNLNVSNFD